MNNPFVVDQLPQDEAGLEELLSRPTPGVLASLQETPGDIVILGVAGKMGVTLAMMARRALDELGRKNDQVIGVARFSDPAAREKLEDAGVETVRCDLLERDAVLTLPDAPNVIFMAGQKFGTSSGPELTWAMNVLVPANACEKYSRSRIVAFSTGCVYPLTPVSYGGSREEDELAPPGDYANSCVGRERVFSYYSQKHQTPVTIYRLNYAIDFRYGVLLDVAQKVYNGEEFDVTMGHANVIWQGDANAQAIQCLAHAGTPPNIFNITGPETVSLRALAHRFAARFGSKARITGEEASTAWLNNAGKAQKAFGYPHVTLDQMVEWVAQWVEQGGSTLGKPTRFEEREGKF